MSAPDLHEQLHGGQLQTILATIPVGVFITDAEGKIVSVNDRAAEIWGGAPRCEGVEAYGQYRGWWPDTGEPLGAEDWAAARALQLGEAISAEMVDIERFDGGRATILTSASPLRDEDGRITGAVVAAQDVTEQRNRQRINEQLLEALRALTGSLELTEVLTRLVQALHEMVGHNRATAFLWHEPEAELELAAIIGDPSMASEGPIPLTRFSVEMQRAVEQRELVIADFSRLTPEQRGIAASFGIECSLLVPLVRGGRLLGVVTVDEMRSGISFSDRDIELASGIASSAGLAIENAQVYGAEHHVATTLQRALLALPDQMEGITFAHAYRSASEEAFVGGDFYDLFEIERDLIGILIGDIAGKGLDAAVLTQLVRNVVRAHAAEKGSSPAHILGLTNTVFYQMTSPDLFATAFFGVLHRSSGRLEYTNAGHTTGLILREDGRVDELAANSPILGAFPDRAFSQSAAWLGREDALLLYTDGVTEARAGGKLYGEERLVRAAADAKTRAPRRLIDVVVDDVLAFAGGSLTDDLAVLALRRTSEEEAPVGTREQMEEALP